MKEHIRRIPWHTLDANLPDREQLPDLLAQLFDPQEKDTAPIVEAVLDAIYEEDTLFGATPLVIPFLLQFSVTASDAEVLSILIICTILVEHVKAILTAQQQGQPSVPEMEYRSLAQQVQTALCDESLQYMLLLKRNNREIRGLAAYILSSCTGISLDGLLELKHHLEKENDAMVRFILIRTIALLHGYNEHELDTLVKSASTLSDRFAYALAMVTILHDQAPTSIEQILAQALIESDDKTLLDLYPPYMSNPIDDIFQAFSAIGNERTLSVLFQTLSRWPADKVTVQLSIIVEYLLDLAQFPKGGIQQTSKQKKKGVTEIFYRQFRGDSAISHQPETLSPRQSAALRALLTCDAFWQLKTNLLSLYELPSKKQNLHKLLET